MLLEILKAIGILFYWTWFIWPFVFIFSIVFSITSLIKDEKSSTMSLIIASVSFLIILSGILTPIL